ncbi:LysR family transcriptional regulator [Paenibacillus aestuarii]|uniref:LysR substrate-binding domain-containing protein n=1 Tax=Paenibacillus aestuarii TaxID=516965 RepID=A0ABW0K8A2_9BACL|nr:LysR family transcriptional regulator [Paenibacillus aestuarii]
MDLRQLTYLLEIAKQQNFTKAAENLHLTQPTLSKMVKGLEAELGVTLFDRSGKYVKLTDTGSVAIDQVQLIMQAVQNLYSAIEDASSLRTGTIHIGLPPVISSVFFPRVIAKFQKLYPHVKFQIMEEGAKKVEGLVLDGTLELGVVVTPVEPDAFDSIPFLNQKLALVLHRDHPLAGEAFVSLAQLCDEPFILFPNGYAVRKHVMRACRSLGFEPDVVYESSQWDLLAEMVAANLGITIMPDAICSKIVNPECRTLELTDPEIPWELVVISRKDKYQSFAMREFRTFVRGLAN